MRITSILTSFVAGSALAVAVVVGPDGAPLATTGAPPAAPADRVAWVAPAGTEAERVARRAVAAAERRGLEAEARFPRDRFEHATSVRYLQARGFAVRSLGATPR